MMGKLAGSLGYGVFTATVLELKVPHDPDFRALIRCGPSS